jgi:hypothetical protein
MNYVREEEFSVSKFEKLKNLYINTDDSNFRINDEELADKIETSYRSNKK